MNRRTFLGTLAGGLLAAPLTAADAQQAGKVPRIGYLSPTLSHPAEASFREGLRELGYVEGQNIAIEFRSAQGNYDRLPGLAAELVRLKVDVIVAIVTQASLAVKQATSSIPIVMVGVADPVGVGLVTSLAHPGGNVTGSSSLAAGVVGKQFEALKETARSAVKIAVLWNPANSAFQTLQRKEAENAGRELGMRLHFVEARTADELGPAFAAISRVRAEALVVLVDPVFARLGSQIAHQAAQLHLPSVGGERNYADAGGLLTYGPRYSDVWKRAAYFVDKILKGAKPSDLAVEQPTKFELVINLKTAKALGLTIPPSLLQRADQVIE